MEEARAKGTSLWLMPEGEEHDRLSALIKGLAKRFGTPSFAPHVTLLPGVPGSESEVLEAARALAAELTLVSVELTEIDETETHFRCLFIRARASGVLLEAHARAARRFGREPDPSFDPHLSLVYGSLNAPAKTRLARELEADAKARFEARHLHVWRTDGPVGEWRPLGLFPLGGG